MNPPTSPLWKTPAAELFVLQEADATEEYVGWLNNPNVNRFLESRFAVHTRESVREFIRRHLLDPGSLFCGIRSVAHSRKHVGNIKLSPIAWNVGQAEIGIMIGDETAWGKGLGTEAIRMMADIARAELGLRKLTAGCYEGNVGSQSAFRRAGFEMEFPAKEALLANGRTERVVRMGRTLQTNEPPTTP
jgi:[ribosomal protein S5]-alanine N-acetyltransferase